MGEDEIHNKIMEIERLRKEHEEELLRHRNELFEMVDCFSDYRQLYCFAKKSSATLEDFNVAMGVIRENYLRKHS